MNVHVQSQPSTCRNNNTLHTQQLGRVLGRKLSRLVARLRDVGRRQALIRRAITRLDHEVVDLCDRGNPANTSHVFISLVWRVLGGIRHAGTCTVEFVVRTPPLQKR